MIKKSSTSSIEKSNRNVIYPIFTTSNLEECIVNALGKNTISLIKREVGQITEIYTLGKFNFDKFIFIGLGDSDKLTKEMLRKVFVKLTDYIDSNSNLYIKELKKKEISEEEVAYIFTETYITTNYKFKKIGSKEKEKEINIDIISNNKVNEAIEKGIIYGEAINKSRDISNMPSNYMTPKDVKDYASRLSEKYGLELRIEDKKDLEKIGAGAILAVNRGSARECYILTLRYNGGTPKEPYTALIGKGITFDSGGYNLKNDMSLMKYDMCGAANVLGAIEIIARMKYKENVMAVLPITENMMDAKAYKQDDVIKSLSGKTIEITNTDAEGRMVLCDAITYAIKRGAKNIIDIATLTGACITALGRSFTGLFCNDEELYSKFINACKKSGEKVWRLPLDESYHQIIQETKIADIINSSQKEGGGACIAASFLEEFIEPDIKWIHLDIAGTGHKKSTDSATGAMIKSMANLFEK